MKEDRKGREFIDNYRKVRKPMPPPERVIRNDKDVQKEEKWDWRKELENLEEDDK